VKVGGGQTDSLFFFRAAQLIVEEKGMSKGNAAGSLTTVLIESTREERKCGKEERLKDGFRVFASQ